MKIVTTSLILIISFISYGQSIINENFEDWVDNTAFVYPDGWITLNDLSPEYGIPFTVLKSTDAKEGQSAAHMQTYTFKDGNNNTDTLPSIMVYGTDINSGVTYTWPKRLKTLSFSYKYKPNGIDTGAMYLTVGYRDRKTNRYVNQGGTYYIFTKREDTYTKVNLPLYYNSNHKCDTFVFAFINSIEKPNGNRCKPGTILIIDDIDTEWEDFPAVANLMEPDLQLGIYPNPAFDIITIKGLESATNTVQIVDFAGKVVLSETMLAETLNIENLKPGFYNLMIQAANGSFKGSTYFIKK